MVGGIKFTDYDIRVWDDGEVSINSRDLLGFAQIGGASGLQCNADEDSHMHKAVKLACMDAASAMRALDETLKAVG